MRDEGGAGLGWKGGAGGEGRRPRPEEGPVAPAAARGGGRRVGAAAAGVGEEEGGGGRRR